MNNDFGKTPNIHIYKPKRWNLALNVFTLFFIAIVWGIPVIALVLVMASFFQAENELNIFIIVFGCALTPLVILMVFNILQMMMSVIMSFFAYIKISPDGIEQKNSPYKHIRSNWADVDKLGKFFLFTDALYLNSFEVLGFSLSIKSPLRFLRPKQGFITLAGYEGWPDGQLKNDFKLYAPRLFEDQPLSQEIQPEINNAQGADAPSVNQETRLLAAICHASVLFANVGLIVPAAIYFTQKRKSPYLGFQALQALIWQIVSFVFTILVSSCMIGSIFIPILLSITTQNERLLELSGAGIFTAILISMILMVFGNLAFIIYGIIGAVRTYQGHDFRYAFIGNRIDTVKDSNPTSSA